MTMSAPRPPVASITVAFDVARLVVDGDVRAKLVRAIQLRITRGGGDHARAERLRDLKRRGGDTAADAPHEHPLALAQAGLRHKHPVGGLEDEREGGRFLERDVVGKGIDVRGRY